VSSGGANQAKQNAKARRIFTTHGRGGANQAAMLTLGVAKLTSKLPRAAQHAARMSLYPSNLRRGRGSTAGSALACVRECDEPVRAERKRSKLPNWPFRREISTPSFIITPQAVPRIYEIWSRRAPTFIWPIRTVCQCRSLNGLLVRKLSYGQEHIGGSIHLEARVFFRVWVKWVRRMGKMGQYFRLKFDGYEQNGLRGL